MLLDVRKCQCPQRASTYFFTTTKSTEEEIEDVCQCPQRASTYFFSRYINNNQRRYIVSMPSTGFYLFLQLKISICITGRSIVSMPSTGFYLFLRISHNLNSLDRRMCQCPQRASTYFFINMSILMNEIKSCVNALNGLLLISSVERGNL